jgi:hypothetical protein
MTPDDGDSLAHHRESQRPLAVRPRQEWLRATKLAGRMPTADVLFLERVLAMQWFYRDDRGEAVGPMSQDELCALADQGIIGPGTLVCSEDSGRWHAAEQVRGLLDKANRGQVDEQCEGFDFADLQRPRPPSQLPSGTDAEAAFKTAPSPWFIATISSVYTAIAVSLIFGVLLFKMQREPSTSATTGVTSERADRPFVPPVDNTWRQTESERLALGRNETVRTEDVRRRFQAVYRAGKEIKAAMKYGVNETQFRSLVRQFATELSVVSSGSNESEKTAADLCRDAEMAYADCLKVFSAQSFASSARRGRERLAKSIGGISAMLAPPEGMSESAIEASGQIPVSEKYFEAEYDLSPLVEKYKITTVDNPVRRQTRKYIFVSDALASIVSEAEHYLEKSAALVR